MKSYMFALLGGLAILGIVIAQQTPEPDTAPRATQLIPAKAVTVTSARRAPVFERLTARKGAQAADRLRFRTQSGTEFTLDRSGDGATLVFPETGQAEWLAESYVSGDVLLRRSSGALAVRLTGRGNAIYYAHARALGEPADAMPAAEAHLGG